MLPQPNIKPTGKKVNGRAEFILTQPFQLTVYLGRGCYTFEIPAGVKTDFASIPRFLWWFISPLDPDILVASLIHDDLYEDKDNTDRFLSDALFRSIMLMYESPIYRRMLAYYAVRLFGWTGFKHNN